MWAVIKSSVTKEIAYGVSITVEDFIEVSQAEIATALRGMVRSAHGGDDAGCDYAYDENEGIVCIAAQPGWFDSRDPAHVQLMKVADMLDGKNFSFDYQQTVKELSAQS
jgi:hypothetical protein